MFLKAGRKNTSLCQRAARSTAGDTRRCGQRAAWRHRAYGAAAVALLVGVGSFAASPCLAEMSQAELQELEENLQLLGFDPGRADGQVDDDTRAAIQRYYDFAFITGTDPVPTPALSKELKGVVAQMEALRAKSDAQTGAAAPDSPGAASLGEAGDTAASAETKVPAEPAIPNMVPPAAALLDEKLIEPAIPATPPLETAAGVEPAAAKPDAAVGDATPPDVPVNEAPESEAAVRDAQVKDAAAATGTLPPEIATQTATARDLPALEPAEGAPEEPPVEAPAPRVSLPDAAPPDAPQPQSAETDLASPQPQSAPATEKPAAPVSEAPVSEAPAAAASPSAAASTDGPAQNGATRDQVARLPAAKAAPAFSDNPAELYSRGLDLYRIGDYESAIAFFSDALRRDPNFAAAYQLRGAAYEATGRLALALEDFDTLIDLTPSSAAAYNDRCSVLARSRRFREALTDCNQALSLNPYDSEALHNRAFVYEKLGEHQRAHMDYTRAYQLNPYDSGIAADARRIGLIQ